MAFSESAGETPPGWQQRALHRSLDRPRARSLAQMHRLVGAARDLADETGGAAFTVAQVAARARLSLKVFYRCFAGKDELLLALLEEDSTLGAALLADKVGAGSDPVERLRVFVQGIFELLTTPGAMGYAGVLVREHRRLSESHPDELRRALAPLVGMLTADLRAAGEAGLAAVDDVPRAAETVFGVVLGGVNDVTLGRADPAELADWIWNFCWSGLHDRGASQPGRRNRDERERR